MIEEYFGFSGQPFKLSPDTKFFFGSASHSKAMAYLHYGLRQAEGFIVITGEIGAGKSMLIGHMLDQVNRTTVSAAHIVTSSVEPDDLLAHVLSAFQIEAAGTGRSAELEAFEDFLFDNVNRGRRVLLVVDEAQNLPSRTIEELRMLTNINHQGTPLFQVFLVGQPEFRETLGRADMEQLRQRVIASYHLQPLDSEETREYIEHRLSIVGRTDKPAFTEEAFDEIFALTNGVPRRINSLCTRLLLFCALERRELINSAVVRFVAAELANEVGGVGVAPTVEPAVKLAATSVSGQANDNDEPEIAPVQVDQYRHNGADEQDQLDVAQPSAEQEKARANGNATLKDVATAIAALSDEKKHLNERKAEAKRRENGRAPVERNTQSTQAPAPNGHEKTVMDHILSLRGDLRAAHQGNREIYQSIVKIEDTQASNVVQLKEHVSRAQTILSDLQRKS